MSFTIPGIGWAAGTHSTAEGIGNLIEWFNLLVRSALTDPA